jgi:Family of unknown function (DUF6789)
VNAKRFWPGFRAGVLATIAMSIVMIVGTVSGISPMPKPIPVAIVATILGAALPKPALIALGATTHLLYGGTFGGVLALITTPVTVRKGLLLGIVLWAAMQVLWLPFLGWGMFGSAVTPKIAGATLLLHLIYGGAVGWLTNRRAQRAPDDRSRAGSLA